jgi:hypothetical protein
MNVRPAAAVHRHQRHRCTAVARWVRGIGNAREA